ncbi:SRPBCC domain-containing protein [Paenibacillus xerothermodurans]|uniref:SRPBCC domain-containing protein n=1 Tax=Paenibacillus xerothermodurans TaxID=1977292 RepID=UPI0031202586
MQEIWAVLTENEKLAEWFTELQIEELREGGMIKFQPHDDTFGPLEIIELKAQSVLEYTWGEDRVRFELYPEEGGCRLILIQKIHKISSHTPKDLAGWHVCLEVIGLLLDGKRLDSREDEWEKWYQKYSELLEQFRKQ